MQRVSIIFTSFNHEKYIAEAIESVLHQTYSDFELIILDDASTDNSWEIICQYTDPRIKKIQNKKNEGSAKGILNAIDEIAVGEFIAMHHSDDVWELSKLEKQIAYFDNNPDVGAVFTQARIIDEFGVEVENNWFIQEKNSRWELLNQLFNQVNHLNHPSVLIRKKCYEVVGPYRSWLMQTPDAEMWSRILLKYPVHIIEDLLTKHRLFTNNSNTSGNRIDVTIRTNNEWNVIRENFLSISNPEDIFNIFPGLERFKRSSNHNIKFLLAMACLYESSCESAWSLGLKWLLDLLNDDVESRRIYSDYGFGPRDFIKITALYDVYGLEKSKQLESQSQKFLSELEKISNDKNQNIDFLKEELKKSQEFCKKLLKDLQEKEQYISEVNNLWHIKVVKKILRIKEKYI